MSNSPRMLGWGAMIGMMLFGLIMILKLEHEKRTGPGPKFMCTEGMLMVMGWDEQGEQDYQPIFIDGDYARCGHE